MLRTSVWKPVSALLKPRITLLRMASAKLKPNTDESSLQYDTYFSSIDAVPRSIVSLDTNYCLINKPSHVRMSGNFSITVEKLLQHWIRGLEIKDLKWIHQLDYATSGILCVGLNRKAAGLASCSFASRVVKKQYLAVLQGHLDINAYPLLDTVEPFVEGDVDGADDESASSLTKRKAPSTPLQPTQPTKPKAPVPVEGEVTWQTEIMEANLKICYEAFVQWKVAHADNAETLSNDSSSHMDTTLLTFHTWAAANPQPWTIAQKVMRFTYADFHRVPKHRKYLRKFLKAVGIDVPMEESNHTSRPEIFAEKERAKEEAANSIVTDFEVTAQTVADLRARYAGNTTRAVTAGRTEAAVESGSAAGTGGSRAANTAQPCIFRARRDVPGGYRLVIRVPVAEIPGDFR